MHTDDARKIHGAYHQLRIDPRITQEMRSFGINAMIYLQTQKYNFDPLLVGDNYEEYVETHLFGVVNGCKKKFVKEEEE